MEIDEFPVEIFYKWWIFPYQEGWFTVLEGIPIRRRRQLGKAVWSCFSRCLLKAGWLVTTIAGFTGAGRVWCRLQEGFLKIPRSEHGNPRGSSFAWQGPAPDVLAVNMVIASNPPWVIAGGPRDLWKALSLWLILTGGFHMCQIWCYYVLFSFFSTIFDRMTRSDFQVETITIFPRGHRWGAFGAPMWMFKFIDPLKQWLGPDHFI